MGGRRPDHDLYPSIDTLQLGHKLQEVAPIGCDKYGIGGTYLCKCSVCTDADTVLHQPLSCGPAGLTHAHSFNLHPSFHYPRIPAIASHPLSSFASPELLLSLPTRELGNSLPRPLILAASPLEHYPRCQTQANRVLVYLSPIHHPIKRNGNRKATDPVIVICILRIPLLEHPTLQISRLNKEKNQRRSKAKEANIDNPSPFYPFARRFEHL